MELKKKFEGIVYKRRVPMTAKQAEDYLSGKTPAPMDSQMIREIDWFMHENRPASYKRQLRRRIAGGGAGADGD